MGDRLLHPVLEYREVLQLEVFHRVADVSGFWGYYLPLDVAMAASMVFELIEWGAAEVFGGDLGLLAIQMQRLLGIRIAQQAFHPNATQFTLQLGLKLSGIWRQSPNRKQSIFCISNISDEPQVLNLGDINLIGDTPCFDLISAQTVDVSQQEIHLAPYQTVWLSNKSHSHD